MREYVLMKSSPSTHLPEFYRPRPKRKWTRDARSAEVFNDRETAQIEAWRVRAHIVSKEMAHDIANVIYRRPEQPLTGAPGIPRWKSKPMDGSHLSQD